MCIQIYVKFGDVILHYVLYFWVFSILLCFWSYWDILKNTNCFFETCSEIYWAAIQEVLVVFYLNSDVTILFLNAKLHFHKIHLPSKFMHCFYMVWLLLWILELLSLYIVLLSFLNIVGKEVASHASSRNYCYS